MKIQILQHQLLKVKSFAIQLTNFSKGPQLFSKASIDSWINRFNSELQRRMTIILFALHYYLQRTGNTQIGNVLKCYDMYNENFLECSAECILLEAEQRVMI